MQTDFEDKFIFICGKRIRAFQKICVNTQCIFATSTYSTFLCASSVPPTPSVTSDYSDDAIDASPSPSSRFIAHQVSQIRIVKRLFLCDLSTENSLGCSVNEKFEEYQNIDFGSQSLICSFLTHKTECCAQNLFMGQ